MPTHSRRHYLQLAEEITQRKNFTKEDSARVSALIAMAQILPPTVGEARAHTQSLLEELAPEQPIDRDIREFFNGARPTGKQFNPDKGIMSFRVYAGLNEGSGTQGGDLVPIGFHADVIEAMRAANGLFDAAAWVYPKGVGTYNYPLRDRKSVV